MAEPRCDGCLGSQDCWVCLGHGLVDERHGRLAPCQRCAGTGRCSLCQRLTLPDVVRPEALSLG